MVSARTGDADKIRGLGFGAELPLKNKGYELLLFLMRHPGQVFSREDLYEMIWGLESMGDNITVAVHIGRIREKLEDDPANPRLLQTVWGVGYRLNAGTASSFQATSQASSAMALSVAEDAFCLELRNHFMFLPASHSACSAQAARPRLSAESGTGASGFPAYTCFPA